MDASHADTMVLERKIRCGQVKNTLNIDMVTIQRQKELNTERKWMNYMSLKKKFEGLEW
jgi:hypothetical protein